MWCPCTINNQKKSWLLKWRKMPLGEYEIWRNMSGLIVSQNAAFWDGRGSWSQVLLSKFFVGVYNRLKPGRDNWLKRKSTSSRVSSGVAHQRWPRLKPGRRNSIQVSYMGRRGLLCLNHCLLHCMVLISRKLCQKQLIPNRNRTGSQGIW